MTRPTTPWPAVACVCLGLLAYLPERPGLPGSDLDASWVGVLHEAARHGWQFGTDIIFTYGPLGYLSVPIFAPDTFWWLVLLRLCVGAVAGYAFHHVFRDTQLAGWMTPLVLLAVLPPTMSSFDLPFVVPIVLWMYLGLFTPGARPRHTLAALSAIVAAIALVKFTWLTLAMGVAVLLTVEDVGRRRQWPIPTIVFLASCLLLWVGFGQQLAHLPAWLATGWDTAAAYSEAMSTPVGPYQRRELLLFALTSLALLGMAVVAVRETRPARWRVVPVSGLALLLFVLFKLGFVRHDAHATVAMFAMPLLGTLVGAHLVARRDARALLAIAGVMALCVASYAYGLRRYSDRLTPPAHYLIYGAQRLQTLRDFTHPLRLHAQLTRERDAALSTLREELPLPTLEGSADLYAFRQNLLLAHQIAYAPRPVFQSYGAYTPALAEANRRFLASDSGPRHVLFDAATIDSRYPLMDDGLSLPLLLGAFEVREEVGAFARLERSATPRAAVALTPRAEFEIEFDEEVNIETGDDAVWADVVVNKTLPGLLSRVAFKLPPLYVEVRTADQAVRLFRIISDVAREGMLLSPLVESGHQFAGFAQGEPPAASQRVTSIRVRRDWRVGYEPTIRLRLFALTLTPVSDAPGHRAPGRNTDSR